MRMLYRQQVKIVAFLFLLTSFAVYGCGEKKEAAKPQAIKKRIERPAALPKKEKKVPSTPKSKPKTANKEEVAKTQASTRIYDPKQRLNPFIPVFGGNEKGGASTKTRKRKRQPQTPLERIGLDQLKLVAIIRASSGNRALVEDTIGKGYIIKNGTYIGLNAGMVTQINPNSVVVEEEVENFKGEFVLQSTEIKLQKPAGE